MEIIKTLEGMKTAKKRRVAGQRIGFVPTMGYLHGGHLSLVEKSLSTCEITVVSIFVNPKQFRPNEDLDTYPIDLKRDIALLEDLGVDILFLPNKKDMYPEGYQTCVQVDEITERLCGKSRPGFFQGVTTVVLKLFNCVQPDVAFFGEKDRQQVAVIQTMVKDLNLDIQIEALPIVRDPDGLASSSRNLYLSPQARQSALCLQAALKAAQKRVAEGESSARKIRSEIQEIIEAQKDTRVDYISVCDPAQFNELEEIKGKTLIALAVHVGQTRLIDNCLIERV